MLYLICGAPFGLFGFCLRATRQVDAGSGASLSFLDLLEDSVRVAEGLRAKRLVPGHVVAVCSTAVADLYPALLGAVWLGLSVLPTDPHASAGECLIQGQRPGMLLEAEEEAGKSAAQQVRRYSTRSARCSAVAGHPRKPSLPAGELRSQLQVCKPRAVFAEPRTLAKVHDALQGAPRQVPVIVLNQVGIAALALRESDTLAK